MPQGLPRRIKLAFIAQALVASVVLCLFLLAIGLAVRQSVVNWAAHREATRFWTEVAAQSSEALPRSRAFDSYFIPAGAAPDALPPAMRGFHPGLNQVALSRFVYVEERRQGRFVLSIDTTLIDTAILVTVLVTLLFALGLSYVMAWMTYRTTKRMVVPVSWLADVVAWWDPRAPDTGAVRASRLPPDSGSEVHQLASALAGLGDRVTDFVQRERDFTRDASHELRTPLTVIRVATDLMLADPDASDRQLRSLARVQRAGRDMEAVIDAFLILAREAEVEPLSEEFDVREVVAHEVARVQPLLAVMIGNLLGNAVRFTDSGRIELHLAPERIEVRDTGIGMTPEALMKAFDPFYRADHAREEGRGMGLSIVRRLGDRFDWPVSLESQPGKGTTAIIRFA